MGPIACSCGGALGGRLCPLRRQPRLLRAEPARAAPSLPPCAIRRGEAPNFFDPPTPYVLAPEVAHATEDARVGAQRRSRSPADGPWSGRGSAQSGPPLIATCSQGSERGANHQGMAHPDTPQTPHKRAPFGGVPRGGQKRGPKKVSKKVSRMGELLNTPFFVHFFAPRGPIFDPPWGDPPKNPHFCCYRYGFGPRKGGFWGVPGSPAAAPGRPGPRPRNFPPGPRARPRAPPRDPPLRDPPWDPPYGTPQEGTPGPRNMARHGRAHDMAIGRSSHSVLVLKIAMWRDALRALWSAVMPPCPPTLATWLPFVLACGHFGLGRRFASPLLPCRRHPASSCRLAARPIGSPKAARSTIARCCRLKP